MIHIKLWPTPPRDSLYFFFFDIINLYLMLYRKMLWKNQRPPKNSNSWGPPLSSPTIWVFCHCCKRRRHRLVSHDTGQLSGHAINKLHQVMFLKKSTYFDQLDLQLHTKCHSCVYQTFDAYKIYINFYKI